MAKYIREIVAPCLMGFILVSGLIGGELTFGMWPFSDGEDGTRNEKDNALLNVSTASQDALTALPDVGEVKAIVVISPAARVLQNCRRSETGSWYRR